MFNLFNRKPEPVYFTAKHAAQRVAGTLNVPAQCVEVLALREGERGTYGAKVRVYAMRSNGKPSRKDYTVAEVMFA